MTEPSEPEVDPGARSADRFDGRTARAILQRAVEEQHRLNAESADSYSVEELVEMAAEAGISDEALRRAIAVQSRGTRRAGDPSSAADGRPRGGPAAPAARLRGRSPAFRRTALAGVGGAALVGALVAFPAFAEVLYLGALLALIVLAVLILVGASPF